MHNWRQAFHLEPPSGWLNDPNGLCWFQGRYHVFFQYCPTSAVAAGPKCWGHYESPDLIHWTFAGVPLEPDTPRDASGVYSGCAVEYDGGLRLYYTGSVKHPGDYDYVNAGRESNVICVETPDARQMGPKKLLMLNSDYPADCTLHVRDPKVWRMEDGSWRMILGARSKADAGRALLYRSSDGLAWTLEHIVEKSPAFGYMWECPDSFTLNGRQYLSVSPQGLPHQATRWQNTYQSGWFPVEGDLAEGRLGDFTEWDMGFDFYAPQTFEAPDGRRILIGWMGMPDADYQNPTAELGWQHCLTVPREIEERGGRLYQHPVRELETLCGASHPVSEGPVTLETPFRLHAEARKTGKLILAGGLEVCYDKDNNLLTMCFADPKLGGGRTIRRVRLEPGKPVTMDLLVDTSSVECYLNSGETVLSTRYYPSDRGIRVEAQGMQAEYRPMRPMEVSDLEGYPVCDR